MTATLCITVAALIYVFAVSPAAAVLIGRACKLRDTHELPAGGCGDHVDPARRAHLRLLP